MYKKLIKSQTLEILNVLKQYNFDFSNIAIYLNTMANNNRVFLVKNGKRKFIVRESNKSKSLKHLELEVNILQYLYDKGFGLTPCIIPNLKNSFITIHNHKYYLLENFLPGSVKNSVNNLTQFNNRKLASLFETLAKFSRAVEDFDNPISKNNKSLFYYVKNGKKLLTDLACTLGQSCYAYRGKARALYDRNKLQLGLTTYRKAYGRSQFEMSKEKQIVQAALRGYMFFH